MKVQHNGDTLIDKYFMIQTIVYYSGGVPMNGVYFK